MTQREVNARNELVRYGKELSDHGLVSGSGGNISIRLEDGCMLFSPTGWSLGELTVESISKTDADGKHLSGEKPTKELPFHLAVYKSHKKAMAVVHTHSIYASSQSCILVPWEKVPIFTAACAAKVGEFLLVPFYPSGTDDLANAVMKGIGEGKRGLLLGNHGVITTAESMEKAVFEAYEIEENAKIFFLAGLAARRIPQDDLEMLMKKAQWA